MCSETRDAARGDGLRPSFASEWTDGGHPSLPSCHCLRRITLIQQIFPLAQSRLRRISTNIAHAVAKMIRITNQAVEIAPLPQFTRAMQMKINLPRRETFPALQQFFQRPFGMSHHQHMHMIGHHDPRNLAASSAVEMPQCISHNLGADRLFKNAFSVARIQPALHRLREPFMVFLFLLGRVRGRIALHPDRSFRFPFITKVSRHGVRQTKGDEVGRALLLPVRQAVQCLFNLCARIEEFHARNDGLRPSIIQPVLQ